LTYLFVCCPEAPGSIIFIFLIAVGEEYFLCLEEGVIDHLSGDGKGGEACSCEDDIVVVAHD
jgi:hypothetical protein